MRGRYAKKRAERLARRAVTVLEEDHDRWGVTKMGRPVNLTQAEARERAKLRNFAQNYGAKEIVEALNEHYLPNPPVPKGWVKP